MNGVGNCVTTTHKSVFLDTTWLNDLGIHLDCCSPHRTMGIFSRTLSYSFPKALFPGGFNPIFTFCVSETFLLIHPQ